MGPHVADQERERVVRHRAAIDLDPSRRDPGERVRRRQGDEDRSEELASVQRPGECDRGGGSGPVLLEGRVLVELDVAGPVRRMVGERVDSVGAHDDRVHIGPHRGSVQMVGRVRDAAAVVRRVQGDGHRPGIPAVLAQRPREGGGRDGRQVIRRDDAGGFVRTMDVLDLERCRVDARRAVDVGRGRRRGPVRVPRPVVRPVPSVLERGVRDVARGRGPVERDRRVSLGPRRRGDESRGGQAGEELVHGDGRRIVRGQGREVPVRFDRAEGGVVGVRDVRLKAVSRSGSGPDRVEVRRAPSAPVFVERDQEGRPLRLEHRAVQDLRHEPGQEGVARRDVAIVHVVAEVRREPHVVRGRRGGSEVVQQDLVGRAGRDDPRTAARVRRDVLVINERIVFRRVRVLVAAEAVARHGLLVRLPREARRLEAVHEVRRVPRLSRARGRVRERIGRATERARGRDGEVVPEAWRDGSMVVRRQARGGREACQVRRGSVARREDVADRLVFHDDREDVIEVRTGRRGGRDDRRRKAERFRRERERPSRQEDRGVPRDIGTRRTREGDEGREDRREHQEG